MWWSFLLLPLLWLWPCAFGARTFVPYDLAEFPPASLTQNREQLAALQYGANHDVTEVPVWFVPELRLARAELRQGALPTWNPWARGGAPLHAHGLLGLCYPPNWLLLGTDEPERRLWLLAWISLALAGLLAFGFLLALDLSPAAAWFGAATFALSAPLAANALFWMRLSSLVWLPGILWALLAIDRAGRPRWRAVAGLALAVAMPWLAGFPPYAAATTLIGAGFAALLVARAARAAGGRAALVLSAWSGGGAGLGLLLAAPQLLPSLRFFPVSARDPAPDLATIAGSSFDFYGLLGYLLPDLFGVPSRTAELPYDRSPLCLWLATGERADGTAALPNYNYIEYSVFAGSLALVLAVVGALRGQGRLPRAPLFGFMALLGMATFVPGLHLLFLLPGVQSVWPMRWAAPATLLLAWLAAQGFDRLRAEPPAARLAAAIATGLLLLVGSVWLWLDPATWAARLDLPAALARTYGVTADAAIQYVNEGAGRDRFAVAGEIAGDALLFRLPWLALAAAVAAAAWLPAGRPWFGVLAGLLATSELVVQGAALTGGRPIAPSAWTPVHDFLAAERHRARDAGGVTIARASAVPTLPAQLPPGPLLASAVRDLHFDTHYDGRSHQPLLGLFGDAIAGKGYLTKSLPDDERLQHPLLDLLGVRFLLATGPLRFGGTLVGPPLRGPGGEFFVYERPHPLPRAFVVPRLLPKPDDEAVIGALLDPAFDPRAQAFALRADLDASAPAAMDPAAAARRARFVVDRPTEVAIDVEPGPAGWLVLADTMLPGWTAELAGNRAAIVRANHSMRAVAVPATGCRVRFLYTAPGLDDGLRLAALAAIGLASLCWWLRRSRPRRTDDDTAM